MELATTALAVQADMNAVDYEGKTPLDYANQLEDGADIASLLGSYLTKSSGSLTKAP